MGAAPFTCAPALAGHVASCGHCARYDWPRTAPFTHAAAAAMIETMWVSLATWIIQDGAPELARGSQLRNVGLRADCLSVGPARTATDGITEPATPGGEQQAGRCRYELTGVAGHAEDVRTEMGHAGWEFVIAAGDQAFLARTAGPASQIVAGSRVTAQCTLSVVADYQWEAFGLPDLRTDWYVRRLKFEQRQIDYLPDGPGGALASSPGKVLRSVEIEKMSRWEDDRDSGIMAQYLLDVTPLRAA